MTTNIICGSVTVKLNHNIAGNLPIELVCAIASFTYKFQHQLKFQPVLQNIEEGTMCVLKNLTLPIFGSGMNSIERRLEQWLNIMHPPYNKFE